MDGFCLGPVMDVNFYNKDKEMIPVGKWNNRNINNTGPILAQNPAPKFSVRTLTVHRLACKVWDSDPRLPMPDKTPAIGKAVKWNNCRIIGTKNTNSDVTAYSIVSKNIFL